MPKVCITGPKFLCLEDPCIFLRSFCGSQKDRWIGPGANKKKKDEEEEEADTVLSSTVCLQ
jgi:hypothetical protein